MKKQPYTYDIEIEKDGVPYRGTYTIERGIMTVFYGMTSNSTQVGAMSHEVLAQVLLREILNGKRWK